MKEAQAIDKLNDLRMGRSIYIRMLNDPTSVFFNDALVKRLVKVSREEIYRLEELIINGELEDSEETFIKYL